LRHNPYGDLIKRKGDEHEARYLAELINAGRRVEQIGLSKDLDWKRAARETREAVEGGAEIVYQAVFLDEDWRGIADFLERQPDRSYEAVDTKLARSARPAHLIQLCFYTEQLGLMTGRSPAAMHVVSGLGERETYRPEDFGPDPCLPSGAARQRDRSPLPCAAGHRLSAHRARERSYSRGFRPVTGGRSLSSVGNATAQLGVGGLVPPDDLDALADALVAAVNNEAGRRERAENAYEQIRSRYAWHTLARRFAAVYDELLHRPRRS
jgi:hypothetical protein